MATASRPTTLSVASTRNQPWGTSPFLAMKVDIVRFQFSETKLGNSYDKMPPVPVKGEKHLGLAFQPAPRPVSWKAVHGCEFGWNACPTFFNTFSLENEVRMDGRHRLNY